MLPSLQDTAKHGVETKDNEIRWGKKEGGPGCRCCIFITGTDPTEAAVEPQGLPSALYPQGDLST